MANWLSRDIWQEQSLANHLGEKVLLPQCISDLKKIGALKFKGKFPVLLVFVAPLLWILVMMLLSTKAATLTFELRAGLSALLPVMLIVISVSRMGWTIVLSERGVDFTSFGSTVHCPWRVFNVDGWPIFDSHYRVLILPLNTDHAPAIEKRRHEIPAGSGSGIRTFQVRFPNASRLRLCGYYGVDLLELGELILFLGRPADAVDARTSQAQGDARLLQHVSGNWRTFDLARDVLPNHCCGCGSESAEMRPFRHAPWYAIVAEAAIESEVCLPVCKRCWFRYRSIRSLVVIACLAIFASCAFLSMSSSPHARWGLIAGVLVLGALPLCIRSRLAGAPAQLRRFSRQAGTVQIWTRSRAFFDTLN